METLLWKLNDAVTNLGDSAILLPVSVGTLLWLLVFHSAQAARAWGIAMLIAAVPILLLKLVLQTCDSPLMDLRIMTPSGHAAFGTAVYGCLAVLIRREKDGWLPVLATVGAVLAVAGICITRIIMNVHSPIEVLIGLTLGMVSIFVFRSFLNGAPIRGNLRLGRFVVVFGGTGTVILAFMLYFDWGLSAEATIRNAAASVGTEVLKCGPK
jgi:membrane-associated phospholipid phosphatase